MEKLLQQLLKNKYPFTATQQRYLQILSPSEFSLLKDNDIIVDNGYLKSILCDLCQETHPLNFSKTNDPQVYCSEENAVVEVKKDNIIKYRLYHDKLIYFLLRSLAKQNMIVEKEKDALWFIGKIMIERQYFHTFFYLSKSTSLTIDTLSPYSIVIYLGDNCIKENFMVFLSLSDITNASPSIDIGTIKDYVSRHIRFVELTDDSRVLLHKKEIASLACPSAPYFFFEYLFKNYGLWKTNEEIYIYVKNKMTQAQDKEYNLDNPNEFSKTMVRQIKNISKNKSMITKIIENNKKTGYRLKNPN